MVGLPKMSKDIRLDVSLRVSTQTAETIKRLARERNLPRSSLVLQALGMLQVSHDGAKDGYLTGLSRDRDKLDTVLVAPL